MFSKYKPLLVILTVILLAAIAIDEGDGKTSVMASMNYFMGLFLVIFAMFKLFDIEGFVAGFRKYDIPSQKYTWYAYLYPFAELFLGIAYLSLFAPYLTNFLTAVLMAVSAYGVIKSTRSGLNIECACLGTFLRVPLSTVSVVENVGMFIMAVLMIFYI